MGTLAAAIKAMAALTKKRDDDALELTPKRTPLFRDYAKQYFGWLDAVKDAKSLKTVQLEKDSVRQWNTKFPEIRVNAITPGTLLAYSR